ncbi:antiviral RADAR system adenosine triphosphatase RdrA [Klebsiella aerogenes]|uniref:antiviral RADAR system adenosine triphosphatase RdrA n=1 Tax=Klebsiella aerogenes TaxID=548 RepID=UPI0027E92DE3|nr:antiviral RADAR system adenosine triphosphatase RdrA [Klebsiella aerogenes]MDY0860224.1 antiviral RADAR system adenosine triphosphatase RdrA [Klebsiella aerogenes]MDY0863240.1 antiviral RADAR system adenosine triphosphatase RdrA [Klebsiella aerogenes]HDU4673925.1 hypothetical protein [Klebsiella aerogenes]
MNPQEKRKYIPLNVGETAVLHDADTLLPREEIYERLAILIQEAKERADKAKNKPLNELRVHNAISIDGARGTGKTAVLVNLKRYLELEHKSLLEDIHVLEPLDPTLLEDGESLFLHIIVAAVLHDNEIKKAQRDQPEQSRVLNQTLDKLAHSLESVDTQKDNHGIDKVRAMYGNKNLADHVQDFFNEAVRLIGKKLLILPIDDVDTSLNRAFENLEIIRRYLTTPYVLPIVSGDRALYNEVTWRDFHGRLTRDSKHLSESAYIRAVELAEEYQRKILPFPRRLTMPAVSSYWQQGDIYLRDEMLGDVMPLRNFIAWLEVFVMGPVNGQEDSRLLLPIPSIRSLTQLIGYCSNFIPLLPDAICTAKNEMEVRRIWQMPTVPLEAIAIFQDRHNALSEKTKREYSSAYKIFADKMKELPPVDNSLGEKTQKYNNEGKITKNDLAIKMADYFRFEPKAGAVYLVLLARQHWQTKVSSASLAPQCSVFDTPLFQPLEHNSVELALFDKVEDLSAWPKMLAKRLPEEWLAGLTSHKVILPYPLAEVGVNTSNKWNYQEEINKIDLPSLDEVGKNKASFLISLLAQYNFYTNAKQTILLNIGRVFELIIASITGPVSREDLLAILVRPPFFSTRALAPTKTLLIDEDEDGQDNIINIAIADTSGFEFDAITELQSEIDAWRKRHNLDQIDFSPWLVYKVFNKVYSQIASGRKIPNGMKDIGTALNMVARTFYATWSAFGSFEKGELFGLPNVVATINLNLETLENFENNDHFNVNIGPFAPSSSQIKNKNGEPYQSKTSYGIHTRTVSYCLAEHPLRCWIDELIKIQWPKPEKDLIEEAEQFLRAELAIKTKYLNENTLRTAVKKNKDKRDYIIDETRTRYGNDNKWTIMLTKICNKLDRE